MPRPPRPPTPPTPPGLIAAGTVTAIVAMLAEARLGTRDPNASDPSFWWGILPSTPPTDTARGLLAALAAFAVIGLCLTWAVLLRRVVRGTATARSVGFAALAWTIPFALGPPLFSRDVYAYAAQGELARRGLDPATHGIAELAARGGADAFVAAVDPRWRETHAPYGGLGVAVEKLAASFADTVGGGPIGAVVLLRVVAVLATTAMVVLTLRLLADHERSADRPRALLLVLTAANPVVIVHLVGGAHLDALAAALLVAALVVDRLRHADTDPPAGSAGSAGRCYGAAAVALACLAGGVKATAFLGLGWLMFVHLRDARRSARPASAVPATLATDAVAAAAALAVTMLASGFGPTWVSALTTSGKLRTGVAPASILAAVLDPPARLLGLRPASGAESILTVTRALTLLAAAAVVGWLALRAWRGPAAHHDLTVIGFGGMAVALGSPVLYPWYLALAVPVLAVWLALHWSAPPDGSAPDRWAPDRWAPSPHTRTVLLLVAVTSIWLCLATMSPLGATWRLLGQSDAATVGVAAGLLSAVALAATAALAHHRAVRRRPPAAPTSTR